MKSMAIILLSLFSILSANAQDLIGNNKIKYVTHAPDGTVAFIITDNLQKKQMQLNASESFYKFEVLDLKTSNTILSSNNRGKSCSIDKTLLGNGNYKLKLYSKNFIITSKITVLGFRTLNELFKNKSLALNNKD